MEWLLAELILLFHITSCEQSCNHIHACPEGQLCVVSTGKCECPQGMVMVGEKCSVPTPADGTRHAAVVTILILVAVGLMLAGVVLIVRRYQLVDWVQQKLEERRNRNVLYEDVMIEQDDPPLAL